MPASKSLVLDASNNLTLPAKLIMPDVTSGKMLVGDGTSYEEVAVSGDIGLASSGAMTIQSDAVEQSMIADDAVGADQLAANAVVNASVDSSAAIADTKLATISTANKVDIGALDIDGASDIGADLADADLIIVDDGANGTEKKSAMSRVKTYVADLTLTTAAQTNITSLGTLTTLTIDNIIINGTNIGHTSDTDSIAIASDGVVTFSQAPVFPDGSLALADLDIDGASDIGAGLADADLIIVDDGAGGTNRKCEASRIKTYIADVTLTTAAQTNITSLGTLTTLTVDNIIINGTNIGHTSDTDAISIGSDGDVTLTQDLELQHDGAILSFGANDEIALTHVHDTGLLLTDSGGTPTLQLHDANESIASDGSKIIMKSGGTTFNMPTADGSDGQFLKTDGSGTLAFAAATADSLACDNLTAGDAAVTISTSSGNITIDATANDSDIILKGTDGGADTDFLTLDGSAAGAATFNGAVTADAGVSIDNITIDGTEIDLSSGNLTLDSAGHIVLDADGGELQFKDGGTAIGTIYNSSSNLAIYSAGSDNDLLLQGNDGGSLITALSLDMSAAGAATFNNDVTAFSDNRFKEDIETIPDGLSKVCKLRGVTYTRIDADNNKHMGVIAQEVEKVVPEVVKTDKSKEKIKSVAYGNMVGLLIEAIKDLKNEVDELKNRS